MKKMKLNIQLFGSGASCSVTVSETVGSATENTSTFTISAKVSTGSQTYNHSSAYVSGSYSGGASGSLSKQSFSINKSSSVTKSWTVTIPHNADGSLGDITFSIRYYVTDSSNGTTTKTVTPTRIARYFSTTPVISLNSKTETTITYNWSTSEWCSAISLNGTGTLSGFGAGTSGFGGFSQEPADTEASVTIDMFTAVLGGEIIVQSPSGKFKIKIKPGTQPGSKVRLKGKGTPTANGGKTDLILTLNVSIPTTLTESQRQLLEQARH
jgi:hypothetical protein